MHKLNDKRIAILSADGFEQSELLLPRDRLLDEGAEVVIVSLEYGTIRGWDTDDWGKSVDVDLTLDDADPAQFHALVLPGGVMNPDKLRINEKALDFVRAIFDTGKVVAAICHAPWILINAGIIVGRNLTSYPSVRQDLENAGAKWHDEAVVVDNGVITSRNPDDLDAFTDKIIEEVCEGEHEKTV